MLNGGFCTGNVFIHIHKNIHYIHQCFWKPRLTGVMSAIDLVWVYREMSISASLITQNLHKFHYLSKILSMSLENFSHSSSFPSAGSCNAHLNYSQVFELNPQSSRADTPGLNHSAVPHIIQQPSPDLSSFPHEYHLRPTMRSRSSSSQ